jgi:hypothetical protein
MEACGFKRSRYGSIMTSSYPTGQIGLLLGEKDPSSAARYESVVERYDRMVATEKRPTYYHPPLQKGYVCGSVGMFKTALSNFVSWLTL